MRSCLVVVGFCLCCSGAMAVPNLHAASGYVMLPDASVGCPGEVSIAGAYERLDGTHELSELADCHGVGWNGRVLFSPVDRLEIGGGYLTVDKDAGKAHAWFVGAKYQVYRSDDRSAALAIGGLYRSWSSDVEISVPFDDRLFVDLPETWSAYLALDKMWCTDDPDAWVPTTTVGVIYTHFDSSQQRLRSGTPFFVPPGFPVDINGRVHDDDFVAPFFGVKLAKGDWAVFGEYRPRLKRGSFFYQDDLWSAAIRKYFWSSRLAVTAGVTTYNLPYTDSEPAFFADIAYRFGQ